MANVVNAKKLNKIRNNYPNIWGWMRHKASWEHMCMGAVLNRYEEYIDELMDKEDEESKMGKMEYTFDKKYLDCKYQITDTEQEALQKHDHPTEKGGAE